jgi:hypothetical protein
LSANSFALARGRTASFLRLTAIGAHPHAGLLAVGELDAGALQSGANGGEIVDCGRASPLLEVPNRAFAEVGACGNLICGQPRRARAARDCAGVIVIESRLP